MVNSRAVLPILTLLIVILLLFTITTLALGAANIKVSEVIKIIKEGPSSESSPNNKIIWQLRFPRILTSVVAGSILAVSGMVFQALFRNPMADPYVLGISSGGAFGVAFGAYFNLISAVTGVWQIPLAAFVGSFGSALLILTLSGGVRRNTTTLLLFGVALNFLLSALMTLFMFLDRSQLQSILQWSMGSFATSSWQKLKVLTIVGFLGIIPLLFLTKELDILLVDEETALSLGVGVNKVRTVLLLCSTLITSVTVAFCGIIGFVGLIVPHIMRLIVGPKHKHLFLFSLFGGAFLTLISDTIARMAVAPSELPVGIITAIAGSPLFIILLVRHKRGSL